MSLWVPVTFSVAAFIASGLTALHATFVPQSRIWGRNISRSRRRFAQPTIALTFDDGPTPASTPLILDILRDEQVPAAFFVIGQNAEAAPDLLRRMQSEGHLIGNHSYAHAHLGMFGGNAYWDSEVLRTDSIIRDAVGAVPRYFRPPVGMKNPATCRASRRHGHELVTWSCRGMDGVRTTPQRITSRILTRVRGGDIIALHDGVEPGSRRDPQVTIDALRPLIRGLREKGFHLARLDELLEGGQP